MIPIDAHQHFWQLSQPFDYRWLDCAGPGTDPPRFPARAPGAAPACGRRASAPSSCRRSTTSPRTAGCSRLAEHHAFHRRRRRLGRPGQPGTARTSLLEMRRHPKFVGVRHVTQDEPDDDFIVRPDVLRGLRVLEKHGVPVRPALLRQAPAARRDPGQRAAGPADGHRPPGQAAHQGGEDGRLAAALEGRRRVSERLSASSPGW